MISPCAPVRACQHVTDSHWPHCKEHRWYQSTIGIRYPLISHECSLRPPVLCHSTLFDRKYYIWKLPFIKWTPHRGIFRHRSFMYLGGPLHLASLQWFPHCLLGVTPPLSSIYRRSDLDSCFGGHWVHLLRFRCISGRSLLSDVCGCRCLQRRLCVSVRTISLKIEKTLRSR